MKSIILLGCFALLLLACGKEIPQEENKKTTLTKDQLNALTFTRAEVKQVMGSLTLNGKVIPDENNLVNVYPMIGGKVVSVNFEIGDLLDTQKPIIVLNSGEAREYEKELLAAQDEYELAKKNYDIQVELNKSKFSSQRELAYARKDLELAKAELARVKEVYNVYSISDGGKYVIKSPVAGFVLEKKVGPNMQIRSDANDYLLSVARLDEVFVAFDVYEKDLSRIKIGQRIDIKSIALPDTVIAGEITRIENIVDPLTRTLKARVLLKNKGYKLKPEMFCTGLLYYQEPESMIAIDKKALIFDKNKYFVMVFHHAEKIETRQVEVYSTTENTAYISSGLSAGEKLINKNQLFVYDVFND